MRFTFSNDRSPPSIALNGYKATTIRTCCVASWKWINHFTVILDEFIEWMNIDKCNQVPSLNQFDLHQDR